jgi:hypothetical protein
MRTVGLYGDPAITWSIALTASLGVPLDPGTVAERLRGLVAVWRHLGPAPALRTPGSAEVAGTVRDFLDTPFGSNGSLLRCAVSTDGCRVVLAAHHGAVDGLGLVALLSAVLGDDISCTARGVGAEPAGSSFVVGSARRLVEAVVSPPRRVAGDLLNGTSDAGDWVADRRVVRSVSSADLVCAVRSALDTWNSRMPRSRSAAADRPVVFSVGASRRRGTGPLTPTRASAYLRLVDVPSTLTPDQARVLLRTTSPEPDFPRTSLGGVGPIVTRALRSRLGATALISNLGRLTGPSALEHVAFYPATGGPGAVAIGAVRGTDATVITIRARRRTFSPDGAQALVDLVADAAQKGS